jgi:ferredoxin-thioredoxin reductase catalytic subunit
MQRRERKREMDNQTARYAHQTVTALCPKSEMQRREQKREMDNQTARYAHQTVTALCPEMQRRGMDTNLQGMPTQRCKEERNTFSPNA